ncbi:MAG: cation diffusion facilitator family transporter [Cohaesibacter sp.]|nr:cation diffusion facilitator family transporter [Cohaesibacter sp.]MCV6601006.1 cation diffusion facilitator family transporter [Cohaesibacter sp.]
MSVAMRLAFGSIFVALIVLGLKYLAYLTTGSVAFFSDALESLVNLVASATVLIAIWLSQKPADHNHPYGHHKAEYLSAVLEGVLIVLAALAIFRESYQALFHPKDLSISFLGFLLSGLAGLINGVWAFVLIRKGQVLKSPALIGDGKHLLSDLMTTIGVLGGVGLAYFTGIQMLDPIVALFVALNILYTGWGLIRNSLSGLMDEAIDDDELHCIRKIIAHHGKGAIEAHDLRSRHAGKLVFLDFHLVVPGCMSVHDAHEICDHIEHALTDYNPGMVVTIHVEPESKAEHKGIIVL